MIHDNVLRARNAPILQYLVDRASTAKVPLCLNIVDTRWVPQLAVLDALV